MKILTIPTSPASPACNLTVHPDRIEAVDTTDPSKWLVHFASGRVVPCVPSASLSEWAEVPLPSDED